LPVRVYIERTTVQGMTHDNAIFCDVDIIQYGQEDFPVGRVDFCYYSTVAYGRYVPSLRITLYDHDETLISVLRDAFAAANDRRIYAHLVVEDLNWEALERVFPPDRDFWWRWLPAPKKDKVEAAIFRRRALRLSQEQHPPFEAFARFDLDYFRIAERWGTPIDPLIG
jgi:hypothetical protein